jgi:hypothetical protein
MARKSRRKKDQDIRLSEAQLRRPGTEEVVAPEPEGITSSSSSHTSELAQEYHYVLADLRRIGVIAIVMLGALVALAFLLP